MIDVGDQITVITVTGGVVRATVSVRFNNYPSLRSNTLDSRPGFRWHTSWDYSEIAYDDEEHGRWIRDYHEEDSDEIKALKATAAMSAERSDVIGYGPQGDKLWGPKYR